MSEQANPFSLTFGKEPLSIIERRPQVEEILNDFTADNPAYQVCMLTGLRGSGKTVMMTQISAEIRKNKEFIVVDLSPERDMLHAFAAQLSSRKELLQIFKDAKINLSLLGFGIEIDGEPPITDDVVSLDRMLDHLTQKGRKVLVTVDEVSSTSHVREFVSQFQIFIRRNYNVFLIMTGLYENIYDLQNQKTLTFLYRAPKIELSPLNIGLIAAKYQTLLGLTYEEAAKMAVLTKGYPFAYQVLGYLCYRDNAPYETVIPHFDAYLEELVYEKLWSELSAKDKIVMSAMADTTDGKVDSIREKSSMNSNTFTVYRSRLLKRGIIKAREYGHLSFVLPRFKEFIIRRRYIDGM